MCKHNIGNDRLDFTFENYFSMKRVHVHARTHARAYTRSHIPLGSILNVSVYNIHTEEHLLSPKRTLVISYRTPADRSRRVMKGTVTYAERGGKEKKYEKKKKNNDFVSE